MDSHSWKLKLEFVLGRQFDLSGIVNRKYRCVFETNYNCFRIYPEIHFIILKLYLNATKSA